MEFTLCDIPIVLPENYTASTSTEESHFIVHCKHNKRTIVKSCYAYTLNDIVKFIKIAYKQHKAKTYPLTGICNTIAENFDNITSIHLQLCTKQSKFY